MIEDDTLDDKLRRAWHSQKSLGECATELGLQISQVNNHWRRLRAEGRLPNRGRRMPSENNTDGRPSVNEYGDDPLADILSQGKR
jgi:predicted ArsR family transcriptional regulator